MTGMDGSRRRRPNAVQWLWYCLGGKLPARLSDWVLYDTTSRHWALRQVARSTVVISPLVLLLLVAVPGPFWIRALSALGGVLMSLLYSLGFLTETAEHRLVKAGYPAGTGARVREQRAVEQRTAATRQRREKMFRRLENRRR